MLLCSISLLTMIIPTLYSHLLNKDVEVTVNNANDKYTSDEDGHNKNKNTSPQQKLTLLRSLSVGLRVTKYTMMMSFMCACILVCGMVVLQLLLCDRVCVVGQ